MKVEVHVDIACAWSRLGAHRLARVIAASGAGTELVHRPYELDPEAPAQARPMVEVMTEMFGSREQVDAMLAEMADLGAAEGAEFRFDRTLAANTFDAHRLLWSTLRDHGPDRQAELAAALFDAQFLHGVDVSDRAELARTAAGIGLDGDRVAALLASDDGIDEVREQIGAARRDGITSVPTFTFDNGEVLSGAATVEELSAALGRSTTS